MAAANIIHVCTSSRDYFNVGGIAVGRAWAKIDAETITPEQVSALKTWVGRELIVRELDRPALNVIGLDLVDNQVISLPAKHADKPEHADKGKGK